MERERRGFCQTAAGGRGRGGMHWEAVTAGRTARFPGTVVTTGKHGPSRGDGREDDTVPGHGGDDRMAWTRRR
jgi:hypothetical protein